MAEVIPAWSSLPGFHTPLLPLAWSRRGSWKLGGSSRWSTRSNSLIDTVSPMQKHIVFPGRTGQWPQWPNTGLNTMDRMRRIDITLWVNIYIGRMWGIPGIYNFNSKIYWAACCWLRMKCSTLFVHARDLVLDWQMRVSFDVMCFKILCKPCAEQTRTLKICVKHTVKQIREQVALATLWSMDRPK